MKTPKERDTLDLLDLMFQLHSRALNNPRNKNMHDVYVEARQELESRIVANNNFVLADVSGSLPMYDVEELNEIVKELNSGKLSLFDFVGKVWNKAYILGCIDGSKGNDR